MLIRTIAFVAAVAAIAIVGMSLAGAYKTEARMVAAWWRSPGHAANMRLHYPCKVTASARSRSGKLYWSMEVGP